MSAYLVTREGKNLGSFEASQIEEGLQNGSLLPSDWGWREGMSGWQGLAEIFGSASVPKSKSPSAPVVTSSGKSGNLKPLELNPYAAPASSSQNTSVMTTGGSVHANVIMALTAARPWMKFVSILLGLLCVAFILSGIGHFHLSGPRGWLLRSLIMWFVAACSNYPALRLSKAAKAITRLSQTRSYDDLQVVIEEQRRFWKSFGIACIIGPGLLILFAFMST